MLIKTIFMFLFSFGYVLIIFKKIVSTEYLTFYALEKANLNCDRICIGRNMTEESVESLTRFVEMDITKLGAIRPWEKKVGNATLVLPFLELTQEEITLFCASKGIQFAQTFFDEPTPFKLSIKTHIEQLERATPGKTLKTIRSYYKHICPLLALGMPNTPRKDLDPEEREEIVHAVSLPLPVWREMPLQKTCEKCKFCCETVYSIPSSECIGCLMEKNQDSTPIILSKIRLMAEYAFAILLSITFFPITHTQITISFLFFLPSNLFSPFIHFLIRVHPVNFKKTHRI